MAEHVGSPNLNDPTARLERVANDSLERIERIAETILPNVVNRPFDSQKVPKEQLKAEYQAAVVPLGAQGYASKLEGFIAQEGEMGGLEMFLNYVESMEGD